MRRALLIALILIAVGVGGALWSLSGGDKRTIECTDSLGCVDIGPKDPIRIGVIQSLSGKVAMLGREQIRGLELALQERHNTIKGHPVLLVTEDTQCRPEGGAIAAIKIVSDPSVVAIFGTTCSSAAAAASEVMSEAGLCMISGNNSASFLTSIGGKRAPKWQPGFFRTAGNEERAGPAAARYAYMQLGIRRAFTIDDGDLYTRSLTNGFQTEFERLGGVIARSASINKEDTDMQPVLEAAVQTKAQLIFFPLFQPEGNRVLQQARAMPKLDGVVLMSDGSLIENSFLHAVGNAAIGMYFVGPAEPKDHNAVARLRSRYEARFGGPPAAIYYLTAYDAAKILFAALEKALIVQPGGSLLLGRNALRQALYTTRAFPGISGILTCDTFGDCGDPRYNVLRLTDPARGVEGLQANVVYTYSPEQRNAH